MTSANGRRINKTRPTRLELYEELRFDGVHAHLVNVGAGDSYRWVLVTREMRGHARSRMICKREPERCLNLKAQRPQ